MKALIPEIEERHQMLHEGFEEDEDEDEVTSREQCDFCRGRGCWQCCYRGYLTGSFDPN